MWGMYFKNKMSRKVKVNNIGSLVCVNSSLIVKCCCPKNFFQNQFHKIGYFGLAQVLLSIIAKCQGVEKKTTQKLDKSVCFVVSGLW